LIVTASAIAQPDPPRDKGDWGPPSPEERVERMTEELGLDEQQQAKLLDIFKAADEERDALRKKHEEEIRKDVCAHFASVNGQVKSVLTETQAAQFDERLARKKAHVEGHHRRYGKGGWPPMECGDTEG